MKRRESIVVLLLFLPLWNLQGGLFFLSKSHMWVEMLQGGHVCRNLGRGVVWHGGKRRTVVVSWS